MHRVGGFTFGIVATLELLSALMILTKKWQILGFYAAFFILATITTYLTLLIHYSKLLPYYFGSILPGVFVYGHLYFNIALLLILLIPINSKVQSAKRMD